MATVYPTEESTRTTGGTSEVMKLAIDIPFLLKGLMSIGVAKCSPVPNFGGGGGQIREVGFFWQPLIFHCCIKITLIWHVNWGIKNDNFQPTRILCLWPA